MKSRMKPAIEIVLSALNAGIEVSFPDGKVFLIQDDEIGVPLKNLTTGEDLFGVCALPFNYFLRQANLMSGDDLFLLSCNTALRKKTEERTINKE
jgi:hypothetical protein